MVYYCLHHPDLLDRKVYLDKIFLDSDIYPIWICGYHPSSLTLPKDSSFKNINEYSLYRKQQHAIEEQIKHKIEYIVVLEDDVLLPDNFKNYVQICLHEFIDVKGDILFLGKCCNISARDIKQDKHVYYAPDYRSRCAHCYMLTLDAAKNIYPHLLSNQCAYDFKLNQVIDIEKLRVCYAEPGILQATEEKQIPSSLQR
jgi:hypothetical protein